MEQKKMEQWLWIDPTINAYWKDENGNLLSIEEVRERLIDDRPLILNNDANWNNEDKKTKENYLDNWMSKLLYWLECPINSGFNVESRYRNTNQTFIRLAPLGYELPKTNYKVIMTHDAAYFLGTLKRNMKIKKKKGGGSRPIRCDTPRLREAATS